MKRGCPDHPKTMDLVALLGGCLVPSVYAQVLGHLEALFHWVARYAPRGDIGRWPDGAIARGALWDGRPGDFIAGLLTAKYLDPHDAARLAVHDWCQHADDSVRKYLVRHHLAFICGCSPYSRQQGYCAQNQKSCRCRADVVPMSCPPLPLPLPLPIAAAAAEGMSRQSHDNGTTPTAPPVWLATSEAIREGFPNTDQAFIEQVIAAALAVYTEETHGAWPELADSQLADAIRTATTKRQRSAGLYLRTVPEVIRTWVRSERPTTAAKPANPQCPNCGDMGFRIAGQFPDGIPAGVLYRDGQPCNCAAGAEFAKEQVEWQSGRREVCR